MAKQPPQIERVYPRGVGQRIQIDPQICNGCAVVRGTRITVQTILEFLGNGDTIEVILQEYPKGRSPQWAGWLGHWVNIVG